MKKHALLLLLLALHAAAQPSNASAGREATGAGPENRAAPSTRPLRGHVQLRVEETLVVLSQLYQGGALGPTGSLAGYAYTNFARRYDVRLGGLIEKGLLRAGLGLRLGVIGQEHFDPGGGLLRHTNAALASFAMVPELGLRLGPLYAGLGFNFVPVPESNALYARSESWEHLLPNAPHLRLVFDWKLGRSPVWLVAGGLWSRPLEKGWDYQNLGLEGGLRFDLTYYWAVEVRYRAWLGQRNSWQYVQLGFTYRFTSAWSATAHWARLLYGESLSPQNRIGVGATWSSK